MFYNKSVFILILVAFVYQLNLLAQEFPCDGSLYLSQNDRSAPTILNKIIFENNQIGFERIASYGAYFNAIGYNPIDQFIYAVEGGSNSILRLKIDGTFDRIGTAENYSGNKATSAAFTPDGVYIIHDKRSDKLHFYQVSPTLIKLYEKEIYWSNQSGNSGVCDISFDDIVVDVNNPDRLISYQQNYPYQNEPARSRGYVLSIDINPQSNSFGQVDLIGYLSEDIILQMGAMFFANDGLLYAYGAKTSDFRQRHLAAVDVNNINQSRYIDSGPLSQNTDGCSCILKLKFTKEVRQINRGCDSTEVQFRFTLVNKSGKEVPGLKLLDSIHDGGRFIENTFELSHWKNAQLQLNEKGRHIIMPSFDVSTDDSLYFDIWARYPSRSSQFQNQAFLSGLNSFVGSQIPSDDPDTEAPNDPTQFNLDSILPASHTIDTTICFGQSFDINGATYQNTGSYQQTLEGASINGCDSIIDIHLTVLEPITLYVERKICFGDSIAYQGTYVNQSGVYVDTFTSSSGCDSIVTLELEVGQALSLDGSFVYQQEKCKAIELDLEPDFSVSGIEWSPSDGLSCTNCLTPDIYIDEDRTYFITLWNMEGCSVDTSIIIFSPATGNKKSVYIPNAFTPHNRDEINDHFTLFSETNCIAEIESLSIYDRWGNLVFERKNILPNLPEMGWGGQMNERKAPKGIYVYTIDVRYFNGTRASFSGDIALL